LGVGIVFGDVLLTNDSPSCTRQTSPTSMLPSAGIDPAKPLSRSFSDAVEPNPTPTSRQAPCLQRQAPAMAVSILAAARFRLPQHSRSSRAGIRDAMFVGVARTISFDQSPFSLVERLQVSARRSVALTPPY